MKKKLVIIIIISVIVGIALIGGLTWLVVKSINNVANKELVAISAKTFNNTMTEKDYIMTDTTDQFLAYDNYILKSYAAQKKGYQIEFYELSSEENAISMYNVNKEKFEDQKTNVSSNAYLSGKNYDTYTLNTNGKYKYLSRIDNTLLYIDVEDTYKNEVKSIVKEIGY